MNETYLKGAAAVERMPVMEAFLPARVEKKEVRLAVRVVFQALTLWVAQVSLSYIPNCELVSTLIIVYTLLFGKEMLISVELFAVAEIMTWGVGMWNFIYIYIWSILVLLTMAFKNIIKENWILWAVFCGLYGLAFGALCALEYLPISIPTMTAYWISGLPWDAWHGFTNFVMMLAFGKLFYKGLGKALILP